MREVGGLAENFSTQFQEWGRRREGKRRGCGGGRGERVGRREGERQRRGGGECVRWAPRGPRLRRRALRPPQAPPPPPQPWPPRATPSNLPGPEGPHPHPGDPQKNPLSVRFRRATLALEADFGVLLNFRVCVCV